MCWETLQTFGAMLESEHEALLCRGTTNSSALNTSLCIEHYTAQFTALVTGATRNAMPWCVGIVCNGPMQRQTIGAVHSIWSGVQCSESCFDL